MVSVANTPRPWMAERRTSWSFFARAAAGATSVLPAWRLPRGLDVLPAMVPFYRPMRR
jgi:hypothetical protein